MRDHDPVAAQHLHVGAAHARGDGTLGATLIAVELAGKQRLECDLVVLDLEQLELESLQFRESTLCRHQQKARIGLGRDDPVFPQLWRLRLRRGRRGRHQRSRESNPNRCFHGRSCEPQRRLSIAVPTPCRI